MLSAIEDCTLSARGVLVPMDVGMLSAVNVKGYDCVRHLSGREGVVDCRGEVVFGRVEGLELRKFHICSREDACA